jgi:hypothetical protein
VRLAVDPAALAWALAAEGHVARAALLQHDAWLDAPALARLRAMRPHLETLTGLPRGALWDLLDALLSRIRAVPAEDYEEFLPLARRLVGPACAPALAVALALEVDAVLAGGPGFGGQDLVPVIPGWPRPRQARLLGEGRSNLDGAHG